MTTTIVLMSMIVFNFVLICMTYFQLRERTQLLLENADLVAENAKLQAENALLVMETLKSFDKEFKNQQVVNAMVGKSLSEIRQILEQ